MKRGFFTVKTIAGLGILTAMVVVLQLLSNYVQFGPVSITLALFPIAVGAMLYGPLGGLFLGLVDGILVLTAPSTISFFFAITPIGTIITCLSKTGLAGLVAGFIFKLYKRDIKVELVAAIILVPFVLLASTDVIFSSAFASGPLGNAMVKVVRILLVSLLVFLVIKGLVKPSKNSVILLTSLAVPIINTGLFVIASMTFFVSKIGPMAASTGQNLIYFIIFGFIGWNFLLEFGVNGVLASAFHNTYKSIDNRFTRRTN